jgi:arylsulfatase
VAAAHPEKVEELKALFFQEARKYQVLPLDSAALPRQVGPKPNLATGRVIFTWTGPLTGISSGNALSVLNTSYTFTVEIEVPEGGGDGMLITQGGRFAGYGFYLLKGIPTFTWNLAGLNLVKWRGSEALSPGRHTLVFDFKYGGLGADTLAYGSLDGFGRSGTGSLSIDGKVVDRKKMDRTLPFTLAWDESLDVGSDTGTPVDVADYAIPFAFEGKIDKITLAVDPPALSEEDIGKLKAAQARAADGVAPPASAQ